MQKFYSHSIMSYNAEIILDNFVIKDNIFIGAIFKSADLQLDNGII